MKIKEDEGKVEVFDKLAKYYEEDIQKQYADGAVPGMTIEPELPDDLLKEAREYTDIAIITICRFSLFTFDFIISQSPLRTTRILL